MNDQIDRYFNKRSVDSTIIIFDNSSKDLPDRCEKVKREILEFLKNLETTTSDITKTTSVNICNVNSQ